MDLPGRWRARAAELERFAPAASEAFRVAADELEAELAAAADELLGPADASRESGLSERRLRELVVEKKLANHGRRGAPRYRRADLPRRSHASAAGGWDAAEHVDAIVGRL